MNALGQVSDFLLSEAHAWDLGQQWQNGHARVAADNRNFKLGWLFAFQFRYKGVGADDVQRSYAKQFVLVIHARFFQHFRCDSNGGVNRVSDDPDAGFRAGGRHLLDQVFNDTGIHVEQVGTIHTWFTCYACGDQHNVCAFERRAGIFTGEAFDFDSRRDVAQVNRHTRGYRGNIVQREF